MITRKRYMEELDRSDLDGLLHSYYQAIFDGTPDEIISVYNVPASLGGTMYDAAIPIQLAYADGHTQDFVDESDLMWHLRTTSLETMAELMSDRVENW